jgi:hypothetical protein
MSPQNKICTNPVAYKQVRFLAKKRTRINGVLGSDAELHYFFAAPDPGKILMRTFSAFFFNKQK